MDSSASDSYLEAQVMTATPQRLRLMLIEGAIRLLKQSLAYWDEDKNDDAQDCLVRARGIIAELLSSIQPDTNELSQKVAGVYVFLFNALTKAQLYRDKSGIAETIEVLEVERETWRLVCEKLPIAPVPLNGTGPREITAGEAAEALGGPQAIIDLDGPTTGGLLLDA